MNTGNANNNKTNVFINQKTIAKHDYIHLIISYLSHHRSVISSTDHEQCVWLLCEKYRNTLILFPFRIGPEKKKLPPLNHFRKWL